MTVRPMLPCTIRVLPPEEAVAKLDALCALMVDAVEDGASVNFIWPMTREKAQSWWRGALASHARGERVLLVAEREGRIEGTVQVVLAPQENQFYRADIAKMMVHRRARRQGIGEALMRAAEEAARAHGRDLLTLDTEAGSAGERLYTRCGWTKFGEVPGFASHTDGTTRLAASFFYKQLTQGSLA